MLEDLPLTSETSGKQLWAELGAAGLLARAYQDGDPARGLDWRGLAGLFTEVDSAVGAGAGLSFCVQVASALPLLAVAAAREAGAAPDALTPMTSVTRQVLAGRQVVALAATDVTPGADLTSLQTTVAISPDSITVSGAKHWIASAVFADYLAVLARHRPGTHFTSFTWVLVPADVPGVSVQPADSELFRGSGTGHVSLREVTLPRTNLLGSPGRGLVEFAQHIAVERLVSALWAITLCRRMICQTKAYLEERQSSTGPLWSVAEIRRRVARCLVATQQLQALVESKADAIVAGRDHLGAALLKASSAEVVDRVLGECAHLQGAHGFATGGAQEVRAQGALWGIGGGTTEVVLSAVADGAEHLLHGAA
ncbi:MAG: citronellyl-CoA dehydrogenase [Pseudonocardiales bacterium]|jgi:citronellyl-CoA dehydrogenase|nr:citronellyl-CoA dehydrogenase [Pseudonocardiales bacterium]